MQKGKNNMFQGSIPALLTPFKDGEVDFKAFADLIEFQIENGSHGVVPCGTTGESPTLTHEEHMAIVRKTVEVVNGRIPVIAGTGSNSTREAIALTQYAQSVGVDAALIVCPYYNKPTQEGLYQHYKAIHDETDVPIVLYNVPGRTVVEIARDTVARLSQLPRIVGVKDATNNLENPPLLKQMCADDFCLLSGEDGTYGAFLAQGGHGIISVVANVAPRLNADLYEAWTAGDLKTFGEKIDALAPLARDMFCETNPVPVKYAASLLGLCEDTVRQPLVSLSEGGREKVKSAMKHAELF